MSHPASQLASSLDSKEGTMSTSPVTNTTGSPTSSPEPVETHADAEAGRDKAIIVAISGPTSSGKTSLSLLLQAVFTGVSLPNIAEIASDRQGKDTVQSITVHQDDYFTSKVNCRLVSFKSTLDDSDFMLSSLKEDHLGEYFIQWDNRLYREDRIPAIHPPEGKSLWRITGPDADCWEALDIPALTKTLTELKTTGVPKLSSQQHPGLEEAMAEVTGKTKLVQKIQQLVTQWATDQIATAYTELDQAGLVNFDPSNDNEKKSGQPVLCFVEGFLLYSDPDEVDPEGTQNGDGEPSPEDDEQAFYDNATAQYDVLGRVPASKVWDPNSTDKSYRLPKDRVVTCAEKQELMNTFDIKLFLPTLKETAKARRFSRTQYVDYPLGGRLAGEHWKGEGYFDTVAWPNYERFHSWLSLARSEKAREEKVQGDFEIIDRDGNVLEDADSDVALRWGQEGGIHVVEDPDADVEDTLRWAVSVILETMRKRLEEQRAQFIANALNKSVDGNRGLRALLDQTNKAPGKLYARFTEWMSGAESGSGARGGELTAPAHDSS